MTYAILLDAIRYDAPDGRLGRNRAARPASGVEPSPETMAFALGVSDRALVDRINAGDTAAFDAMVAQWWTPLWRFVRREVESDAVAEDVVQDVFSWIWTHRERWAPGQSVRAYLYRMVRNRLIGERRHARVVRAYTTGETAVAQRDVAPERTSDLVEQAELVARLEAALARLPEAHREAVLLRYVHGCTHAEVAAVLGVTVAAAEKQVWRALEKLRAWLGE